MWPGGTVCASTIASATLALFLKKVVVRWHSVLLCESLQQKLFMLFGQNKQWVENSFYWCVTYTNTYIQSPGKRILSTDWLPHTYTHFSDTFIFTCSHRVFHTGQTTCIWGGHFVGGTEEGKRGKLLLLWETGEGKYSAVLYIFPSFSWKVSHYCLFFFNKQSSTVSASLRTKLLHFVPGSSWSLKIK